MPTSHPARLTINTYESYSIPVSKTVARRNILAVEVHQNARHFGLPVAGLLAGGDLCAAVAAKYQPGRQPADALLARQCRDARNNGEPKRLVPDGRQIETGALFHGRAKDVTSACGSNKEDLPRALTAAQAEGDQAKAEQHDGRGLGSR